MRDFLTEVWAVALRDFKKKSKFLTYLGGLVLTASIILLIGLGFDKVINLSGYGISYSQYFSPGILLYFLAISGFALGEDIITDRKGFLRLLLVTPISRFSILFGKILSGIVTSLKQFFLIIIFFLFFFRQFTIVKCIGLLLFICVIMVVFYSFGLWLSSTFRKKETARNVTSYASLAMLFLSGIFYPIEVLPKLIQYILYINPLTYTVDLFRYLMVGEHSLPLALSIIIFTLFGLVSLFLGTYLFDKNLRR